MQIQISWLLKKPTDLDLHCLQNSVYPGSAGQELIYQNCMFSTQQGNISHSQLTKILNKSQNSSYFQKLLRFDLLMVTPAEGQNSKVPV